MFESCHKPIAILALAISISAFAADKSKTKTAEVAVPSYEAPQPATENLDLTMYQRIREEGLRHSHVMEYASALSDDIGPRLTGSPNMARANAWTRDQFAAMGCANAHLEDWGEFGMGWQQVNTWVRMTSPDTAIFIAQAAPWSPATNGPTSGDAVYVNIQEDKDFDQYKGKLAGKIVMLGEMRAVPPVDKVLFSRYSDKDLEEQAEYPVEDGAGREIQTRLRTSLQRNKLAEKMVQFLVDEKASAVIRPSRDSRSGGGSGGTIFDDNGVQFGAQAYLADHKMKVPVVVVAIENYGRVFRLLQSHVPVTIEMDVETKFTGDHERGFNTIAEIPGTDPKLKDEVVMVGGHLDSWIAGTGATDNGAGSVVAMEVARILTTLGVHPRRTIRFALWSGEEQGLFGSRGYVKQHFGYATPSTAPDQMELPEFMRKTGPLDLKPEHKLLSAYFNIDYGHGKIRGMYLEGNAAIGPIFAQWIAPLKDLGVITISMRGVGSTDHVSFEGVGLPGFQFIQDQLDYESRAHHSNMDTYERLQPGDLKQIATVEAIFVYNAAMRDLMLPRKPVPHPELLDKQNAPLPNLFPGATSTFGRKQISPDDNF
jgi:carboxypeptidase Q